MSAMGRIRRNRDNAVRGGFSLQWRSKTNSSKRTVAMANLMEDARNDKPAKNTKAARRSSKKDHKLGRIRQIKANDGKSVPRDEAQGMRFGANPDLDRYTSDTATVHWMDQEAGVFSVMVIPKESTRKSVTEKSTYNTVRALERLQATEKTCRRSKSKSGTSTSGARYAIFGNKVHRGGHGFVHDKLSKTDPQSARTLEKWARRMERLVCEFIPSGWLRAISKANGFCGWPTVGRCRFVAAMASSVNYDAPAHDDDDYLFSIHQVNVVGHLDSVDVVQWFCFPTYGFAIGLRPGDVILFNPHVHHCLSEKTEEYSDVDVHVTTFYVKTAHVGKNDNSLPLTEEEQLYYNMTFE